MESLCNKWGEKMLTLRIHLTERTPQINRAQIHSQSLAAIADSAHTLYNWGRGRPWIPLPSFLHCAPPR